MPSFCAGYLEGGSPSSNESDPSVLDGLPKLFEKAIELKLKSLLSELETRLADRLREELKDTRLTMRDAMEVNSRSQDTKLEAIAREIISEMPRSIFGRRGK